MKNSTEQDLLAYPTRTGDVAVPWDELSEDDQSYWNHEADAVLRAAARGGFKDGEGDTMGPWLYQRFGDRH